MLLLSGGTGSGCYDLGQSGDQVASAVDGNILSARVQFTSGLIGGDGLVELRLPQESFKQIRAEAGLAGIEFDRFPQFVFGAGEVTALEPDGPHPGIAEVAIAIDRLQAFEDAFRVIDAALAVEIVSVRGHGFENIEAKPKVCIPGEFTAENAFEPIVHIWPCSPSYHDMRKSEPRKINLKHEIQVEAPFDWDLVLRFLRPRAISGLEEVDETNCYRRRTDEGTVCVRYREGALEVNGPDGFEQRIRHLFDADAPALKIHRVLGQRAGLRVPGCWDPFELAVRAVLGQQVSVAAATTVAGRLLAQVGSFRPETLAMAEIPYLPRSRAETLRGLARFIADGGRYDQLEQVRGIGPWTQQYVGMRALKDRDAFPASDLVLKRAAGAETAAELERMAEAWRPYRAYAAMYLWQFKST